VDFSISELIQTFHESPFKFLQEFWISQLQGLIAWLFIAPVFTAIVFFALVPPLKHIQHIHGLAQEALRKAHHRGH
jgi:hypothetical protein